MKGGFPLGIARSIISENGIFANRFVNAIMRRGNPPENTMAAKRFSRLKHLSELYDIDFPSNSFSGVPLSGIRPSAAADSLAMPA